MVHAIRNIERAMGDGIKRPSISETKNKLIARKTLVAAVAILLVSILLRRISPLSALVRFHHAPR